MRVASVMTPDPAIVTPDETLRRAARMMDDMDVGALPVCDGRKLVGMITDRDITTRATAAGEDPDQATVGEVMTEEVRWCTEDDSVEDLMLEMADAQIRRVPVVDRDKQLVGIVSLGDLAAKTEGQDGEIEETLGDISHPARPDR